MPYLAGISSMVKLGTRIYSAPNYSTPPNLYLVIVAPTGSAKTDLYQAIVKGPAEDIIERQRQFWQGEHAAWKAAKGEDKGVEPSLVISQIEDYTPVRLDVQLQAHAGVVIVAIHLPTEPHTHCPATSGVFSAFESV